MMLTDLRSTIFAALESGEWLTRSQIEEKAQASGATVHRYLKQLSSLGLLEVVDSRPSPRYKLNLDRQTPEASRHIEEVKTLLDVIS